MFVRYALLLPLLAAMPASAGEAKRIEVSYADLNLVSAAGQATLEQRIARALRSVCSHDGDRSLAAVMAARKCREAARSEARSRLEVALLRTRTAGQLAGASAAPGS